MLPISKQQRAEVESLCRKHRVVRLELFGSAATDAFEADRSDLDFFVEFLPLPPVQKADAYFGLLHDLEDLFHRKIDLVTAQARHNRWFQQSLDAQRTLLYAA